MKLIATIILLHLAQFSYSSADTLDIESFTRYYQTNFGLTYGNLVGNVSEFTKHGGSLDLALGEGRDNHFYGFNMNIFISNKVKEFSLPRGYEHYRQPASFFVGLFYGQTIGNPHRSHFYVSSTINYGWLLFRKRGDDIGGYHGIVPQLEIGRSFRIGKPNYSVFQFTSQYTPRQYDPSVDNKFLDLYMGYKQLILNDSEGKGGILTVGIRYKMNQYSIDSNTKNK